MTTDAPLMLGVSGLRAVDLDTKTAARFARAFGIWLRERKGSRPTVCIGGPNLFEQTGSRCVSPNPVR